MFDANCDSRNWPPVLARERGTVQSWHAAEQSERLPADAAEPPLFTVIMPVYDEQRTLETCMRRTLAAASGNQVIVVDDGSSDRTVEIARKFAGPQLLVLLHKSNRGKGAAIRTALEHAAGEFTIIQDGDLEYDPSDYARLLEPLLSGEADVVFGSRYLNGGASFHGRRRFDWGVRLLNVAVRLIYGLKTTDEATCYKVLRTSALRAMGLRCERFDFCPEVTAKACRLGLRIKDVPIRYSPRRIDEGKKIRARDGLEALRVLWTLRKWHGE